MCVSSVGLSFQWCFFLWLIVVAIIYEQNFGEVERKIVWPTGRQGVGGKRLVQCRVRGTSAPGWPNTRHGRLPIRKPLKPPTVKRKNCRNIKIVFVSTYALRGWKTWISSPVVVSPVRWAPAINYSLTKTARFIQLMASFLSNYNDAGQKWQQWSTWMVYICFNVAKSLSLFIDMWGKKKLLSICLLLLIYITIFIILFLENVFFSIQTKFKEENIAHALKALVILIII